MRCVECGERLAFAPTNVTQNAPGVPFWLQGEMLAQWVADETESPAKEAVDWTNYSCFDRPGRVSLWLGDFTERSDFESYLDDGVYWASDDETTPLNRFAAEFGIGYYDHDFQDAHWSEKGKVPIGVLLKGASYVDSFLPRAVQAAEQAGWRAATTFVLLYDFDYSLRRKPPSDSRMVFIGTFDYTNTR